MPEVTITEAPKVMTSLSTNQNESISMNALHLRIGDIHPLQIRAWQRMTPAQRLQFAFQAYQFALNAVRISERRRHPHLSITELNWRVTRRMQHDRQLGITPNNGTANV